MIFLLGGYDLEMLTIKELLDSNGIRYIDKKLSWGAKLSSYKNELLSDEVIYGIELEEDITPPQNYKEIDHHNNNTNKPSSLEQIATILCIDLNRHQQLVALNDSRHIKGMQSICATKDEIKHIRFLDKKAQGITPDDENLADESIQESKNSNIIYSKTEKFTAISDKVYNVFDNYIIYNDLSVSFYGYKIQDIISFLEERDIDDSRYYYGGGDFGFLGIKKKFLHTDEIENLIKEFTQIKTDKEIISHHIFMLPFIFKDKKDVINGQWKHKPYIGNYNEIAYFHNFFKDSMFREKENDNNSSFYTNEAFKGKVFTISKSKEYRLTLASLNLRIFETDVGILSFHLENRDYSEIKDILEINDYGRRIYPEYLDKNLQCSVVANFLQLGNIKEKYFFADRPKEIRLSKIIENILSVDKILPAVDDRMFVISFYKNSTFSSDLKRDYIKNNQWYEYVYIDGSGKTVQNEEMQTELIKKASYARWQGYGTMYGISKYSFVCLAEKSDFIESTVEKHMKTMYFQMFSLLLMVRATILKFSREVSDIAQNIDAKDTSEEVNNLYKRYIKFVNSFYFREITAKDQGLEIYEKALAILNIERDIKDLDAEIEELHKYVEIQSEKETAKNMNMLTWIGGVLLPPTIVTSFFGMNVLENIDSYEKYNIKHHATFIIFISVIIIPSIIGIKKLWTLGSAYIKGKK